MAISLSNLKKSKGYKRPAKRLGRGWGSGKGKYSTKGVKGQKARTGGRGGLKLKGMKANIQNLPKLPGFTSIHKKIQEITLKQLEQNFNTGDKVNFNSLSRKGMVRPRPQKFKVLSTGELKKSLTVFAFGATADAKAAIEKAGGKIILPKKAEPVHK